eukprot:1162137-Pelagomonas_calceolata.AAC.4
MYAAGKHCGAASRQNDTRSAHTCMLQAITAVLQADTTMQELCSATPHSFARSAAFQPTRAHKGGREKSHLP